MSAPASGHAVRIQDRRELPFFQVRLRAVRAIRARTHGPRRLRAFGFYALLCQLANEQRHVGEHRRVQATYDVLAGRGKMSKGTVKQLLDELQQAEVVRYERLVDRETGTTLGVIHLLVLDDPWIALTVEMALHLAADRDGGHLLRDLGLVVVMLEFCAGQREEHGGLAAEILRADIADRAGVGVDRVDDCNRALERAGILEIERRRAANGGRHLPSVYTIHEAPAPSSSDSRSEGAGRPISTGRAADEYSGSGAPVPAGPHSSTHGATDEYRAGGFSATGGTEDPPSYTRPRDGAVEEQLEKTQGGDGYSTSEELLCDQLIAAWEPVLGRKPRRQFDSSRSEWLRSARELLEDHPWPRLAAAIAYMPTDSILGSRALTMPTFAKVADELIVRAHAGARRVSAAAPASAPGMSWPEARRALEHSIQRYGRDDRAAALAVLAPKDARFMAFVKQIGWRNLCEQSMQYTDRQYGEVWNEISSTNSDAGEELAA